MDAKVHYVGLDYHQNSIQVCVMNHRGEIVRNQACANRWDAVARCAPVKGSDVRAAIESCAGAANLADELVQRAGWSVSLAHAGYVARIKQSPDKTDWADARLLADLERVGYLPRVWLAPEAVRELRRVTRYRQDLVKRRRTLKLRIGALLRDARVGGAPARRWTRGWIEWLAEAAPLPTEARWVAKDHLEELEAVKSRIKRVEEHLAGMVEGDALVARLLEQKGIGLVTACTLRAEIGRFDRFRSGKQLARFCGGSPRNASSGSRQADAGLIRACNRTLRATIIEAAHRLVRFVPRWSALFGRLRRRGKPPSVAVAAVANRWLRWLYHQMRPLGAGC